MLNDLYAEWLREAEAAFIIYGILCLALCELCMRPETLKGNCTSPEQGEDFLSSAPNLCHFKLLVRLSHVVCRLQRLLHLSPTLPMLSSRLLNADKYSFKSPTISSAPPPPSTSSWEWKFPISI